MSIQSLMRRISGAALVLVALTACGGFKVSGETFKVNGFGSPPGPRSSETDNVPQTDFFQQVQGEERPGFRLDTSYGEFVITGHPNPMVVMVIVTTEI